jgi:hypothetical protein
MARLTEELEAQFEESEIQTAKIRSNLKMLKTHGK